MEFFTWLEATPLAEWVRTSSVAYPLIITLHALGMGIMTGLSWIISMRILGYFRNIPYASLKPLFAAAWIGFWVNAISGGALFTSQAASNYVHNIPYLTKMFFVIAGAVGVLYMQAGMRRLNTQGVGSDVALPQAMRVAAGLTIFIWFAAIVTGRLIAYLT